MAELRIDLILGSHPHIIQPTDTIKMAEKETFAIYSIRNFVSNRRVKTLDQNFARTEDGIIIYVNIEENYEREETTIAAVDFVLRGFYKGIDPRTNKPIYRTLPIEQYVSNENISSFFKTRMEKSDEAAMSQVERD